MFVFVFVYVYDMDPIKLRCLDLLICDSVKLGEYVLQEDVINVLDIQGFL